jgi:GNAT superfamily N-acetyltransferase
VSAVKIPRDHRRRRGSALLRSPEDALVIAVLPEYEGKGVGGRLMALAEE